MAKHRVTIEMPPREIKRADVSFIVRRDGKVYGTLEISNGSIVWFPASTNYGCRMGWKRFHELMEDNATNFEKR